MKIAMVSTEKDRGGAARMASLLARILVNKYGLDLIFLHCEDNNIDPPFYGLKRFGSRQINAALARIGGSICTLDLGVAREITCLSQGFDILHIHNLHGYYVNWPRLLMAWRDRPIVWTWHDQWGATGRCGFAIDCEGWRTGCLKCAHKDYYPAALFDRAACEYNVKSEIFMQMKNMFVVAPSEWLAKIAIDRGIDKSKVVVIPNPVDVESYKLIDKAESRAQLGLPANKVVALFVAADCNDPRKGYADFVEVTHGLDLYPVAVGLEPRVKAPHVFHVGVVRDREILSKYYCSADFMVFTSKADNYPNTVIESLISGTPVVAYDVGGVRSQLDSHYSRLVDFGDIAKMRSIMKVMSGMRNEDVNLMRTFLHNYAHGKWAGNVVAEQYVNLYSSFFL